MHAAEIAIALAAGLALAVGIFTRWVRRHWMNEPVLALLLGVLVGPVGLGWLDLSRYGDPRAIVETVARFTLAVALVSVGVEVRASLGRQGRSLLVLVALGTLLMWASSTLLVMGFVGLSLAAALLIGAVLAPTDPILTASVSTGSLARENLPARLRKLLSAESAARHGLGLMWVALAALLLEKPAGEALGTWVTHELLKKTLGAVALGSALGLVAGLAARRSAERGDAEAETGPLPALLLALGLCALSAATLLGLDALLAVLAAGLAFAFSRERGQNERAEMEEPERSYESLFKQVLQVPVFLLLGAALPWTEWASLGWAAAGLVLAMLFLRRIPALLLLRPLVPELRRRDEALFAGFFGPAGVGALYLAAVASGRSGLEQAWTVGTLVVAASIVAHDLTVTPFSRWLGARLGARGEAETRKRGKLRPPRRAPRGVSPPRPTPKPSRPEFPTRP